MDKHVCNSWHSSNRIKTLSLAFNYCTYFSKISSHVGSVEEEGFGLFIFHGVMMELLLLCVGVHVSQQHLTAVHIATLY